jgi:hypothetical protein
MRQNGARRAWALAIVILISLLVFGGTSVAIAVLISDDLDMELVSCLLGLLPMRVTQCIAREIWRRS